MGPEHVALLSAFAATATVILNSFRVREHYIRRTEADKALALFSHTVKTRYAWLSL
jgi:hypothetical protein